MIIPVIHIVNYDQVKMNVETCLSLGQTDIFLINHGYGTVEPVNELVRIYDEIRREYPNLWIGSNFLQLDNLTALTKAEFCKMDGLWTDNASLIRIGENFEASKFDAARTDKNLTYFGGVEFKYQKQPSESDYEWLYKIAVQLIDVITTSGPGTGKEIKIEKLERIRAAVGKHPIAVASGVNEHNIVQIEKYADYTLVASSITDSQTELIRKDSLKRLIEL